MPFLSCKLQVFPTFAIIFVNISVCTYYNTIWVDHHGFTICPDYDNAYMTCTCYTCGQYVGINKISLYTHTHCYFQCQNVATVFCVYINFYEPIYSPNTTCIHPELPTPNIMNFCFNMLIVSKVKNP